MSSKVAVDFDMSEADDPSKHKRRASQMDRDDDGVSSSPRKRGVAFIDSILGGGTTIMDGGGDPASSLSITPAQAAELAALRDYLVSSSSSSSSSVPRQASPPSLPPDKSARIDGDENREGQSEPHAAHPQHQHVQRRSSIIGMIPQGLLDEADTGSQSAAYLAAEYGGVTQYIRSAALGPEARKKFKKTVSKVMLTSMVTDEMRRMVTERRQMMGTHLPAEWDRLGAEAKAKLRVVLSWEGLGRWDFDVFELAELTEGHPLLFVGWAVLASPYAQQAMAADGKGDGSGAEGGETSSRPGEGYMFISRFDVPPATLCSFLRTIEFEYRKSNPYHNSTHAADVLQTTHALLQFGADKYSSDPLELYALLLSAAIHDVDHPGMNNCFQVQAKTELALRYNDDSVLENMHLAKAFRHLMGEERQKDLDVLGGMDPVHAAAARKFMIKAVMGTEMSRHFECVARIGAKLDKLGDGDSEADYPTLLLESKGTWCGECGSKEEESVAPEILWFALHLADISSQAKPGPHFSRWGNRVLDEFFAQGDMERERGLPVSPLCDRHTTARAESQVGFIKFIVKPAYELLGRLVPRVATAVLPLIEDNLAFWEREKENEKAKR